MTDKFTSLDESFTYSYEDRRRYIYFRLIVGLTAYIAVSNIMVYIISKFIKDTAVIMILASTIALLISSKIIPNPGFKVLITYKKEDAGISKVLILVGYMFVFSLIFGLIANYLINFLKNNFNIINFNVTEYIVSGMNIPMFIYAVLIGPFFEEYLFRGLIAQNLAEYNKLAAIIFSALSFALFHQNLQQTVSVLGMGFLISYVGINYSWKLSFVLHIINNIYATTVFHITLGLGKYYLLLTLMGSIVIAFIVAALVNFVKSGWKNFKNNLDYGYRSKENFKKFFTYPPTVIFLLVMVLMLILSTLNMRL